MKNLHKYVYPAIFTEEESGMYSVVFPDIKNCYTVGNDLNDAIEMAEDVLALMLCEYENRKKPIPKPSKVRDIKVNGDNEFVSLIACDTLEYRRQNDNRAVKKTLTIPSWLNTMSENAGVNYSAVLKEALIQRLGL